MIIALCSLVVRLYAVYWMFKDTKKMGLDSSKRFMWTIATLFVWWLAVPVYFILVKNYFKIGKREAGPADNVSYSAQKGEEVDVSEKVTCPMCKRAVPSSFSFCPHCGYTMKPQCSGCGKTLEPEWTACPHCGTKVGEDAPDAEEDAQEKAENKEETIEKNNE